MNAGHLRLDKLLEIQDGVLLLANAGLIKDRYKKLSFSKSLGGWSYE